MTCREMDGVIISDSTASAIAPEAAEHIAGCERCRRLMRVLDEGRQVPPPSTSHMKRIEEAMLGNLIPVEPLAPARTFLIALASVFLAAFAVGSVLLGTHGWQVLSIFQKIGVFMPLAACAGMLAWSLVRLMVPGSKHLIPPCLVPIGVLLLLALVIAAVFHLQQESGFVRAGLMCMSPGFACAVPAAVLFWLLVRRGAILSPGLTGATAGGLAGLVGLMGLEVRCPNLNGYHILVWHWGVPVLAVLGGLALGRLANRQRNRFEGVAK